MLLTDDLQGECNAEGEDARINQGNPARKNIADDRLFRNQHNGSGKNTAEQALNAVQPQAVQFTAHLIHKRDLHRITQCAAQQVQVTDIDLRHTDTA